MASCVKYDLTSENPCLNQHITVSIRLPKKDMVEFGNCRRCQNAQILRKFTPF